MRTTVGDLWRYLDGLAPYHLQEDYDNSGIVVGDATTPIQGLAISLDVTPEVIDEAISCHCNVILSHHPAIFAGLKVIDSSSFTGKVVTKAIKNDIVLISCHTNLDNVLENGVNQRIAETIGISNTSILRTKNILDEKIGSGIIGQLSHPMQTTEFLDLVKNKMGSRCIKYTELIHPMVDKVAICGGSGSFLLEDAKEAGAQVFISSDFKYHDYFNANGTIIIADIGHYESEQYTSELLIELIQDKFRNFAAHNLKKNTNPIKYLV